MLWTVALLEALLRSHVASGPYRGVSSLTTLLRQPFRHGGMVAFLVVIADGAASAELFSLFSELCFICVFDMYVIYVLYVCMFFFLCVHMPKGIYMNN